MKIRKSNMYIFAIVLIALAVRMYRWNYYDISFFDGGIHAFFAVYASADPLIATIYKPPLFFDALALVYKLAHNPIYFRLFNIFLSVGSIAALFYWVKKEFSLKIACIFSLLLALDPTHFVYAIFLNPDSMAFLLGSLILLSFAYLPKKKPKLFAIAGVLMGLLVMTRLTSAIFFLPLGLYVHYKKLSKYDLYMIALGFGIIMVPWMIMLYMAGSSHPLYISNYIHTVSATHGLEGPAFYLKEAFGSVAKYVGIAFLLSLVPLLRYKSLDSKCKLLYLWMLMSLLLICFGPRFEFRYFAMQTMGLVPLYLLASYVLAHASRNQMLILLALLISYDAYLLYEYHFGPANELNSFNIVSMDASRFMVDIARNELSKGRFVLTNVPFDFLKYRLLAFYSDYEPHWSCPNSHIHYLLLVNSSRNPSIFPESLVSKYSNSLKLEQVYRTDADEVYVYSFKNGSNECILVPPIYHYDHLFLSWKYITSRRYKNNIFINLVFE